MEFVDGYDFMAGISSSYFRYLTCGKLSREVFCPIDVDYDYPLQANIQSWELLAGYIFNNIVPLQYYIGDTERLRCKTRLMENVYEHARLTSLDDYNLLSLTISPGLIVRGNGPFLMCLLYVMGLYANSEDSKWARIERKIIRWLNSCMQDIKKENPLCRE